MESSDAAPKHSLGEDIFAIFTGALFISFGIVLFKKSGLLTGGTSGVAFLAYYLAAIPFGLAFFVINLPFYVFAYRSLGRAFTLKTFVAVSLLAVYTETLPALISLQSLDPIFAAVMAGFLAGVGLLMLIRHQASLGGLGVLAIHLQNTRGWRAGKVQMAADVVILGAALFVRDPYSVALSILGALALNLVIAVNHKAGRYMGI